jgi:hypothetical protein
MKLRACPDPAGAGIDGRTEWQNAKLGASKPPYPVHQIRTDPSQLFQSMMLG